MCTALSDEEIKALDAARGMLDRSVFLRSLIVTDADMRAVVSRSQGSESATVDPIERGDT